MKIIIDTLAFLGFLFNVALGVYFHNFSAAIGWSVATAWWGFYHLKTTG